MGIGTKTVWKCDVCKHEWLSQDNEKPLRCAKCKSPYWDRHHNSSIEQARQAMKLRKRRGGD